MSQRWWSQFLESLILLAASCAALADTSTSGKWGPSQRKLQDLETSTLVEWAQNLGQACGKSGCSRIDSSAKTQNALRTELEKRFEQETGRSPQQISLAHWENQLLSRSDADRCRLLRTAFVIALVSGIEPTQPQWRLFTHERPRALLTKLGHRSEPGKSPLCPDYFFPESDVLDQALERGARLFSEAPPTEQETLARLKRLETRYLSRGPLQRAPFDTESL
jgi:hypothetical protein